MKRSRSSRIVSSKGLARAVVTRGASGGSSLAIVGLEQASRSAVPLLSNMMR